MDTKRPAGILLLLVLIGTARAQGADEAGDAAADGALADGAVSAAALSDPTSDPTSDPAAEPPADPPGETLESCFNADGLIDISVLDDAHLYIRTRGNNSYLATTEVCAGMERSYLRRTARLVPFGREVCANDGSHVIYEASAQERVCPLRFVTLVADREQARQIAAGNDPIVIFEELPVE